MKKTTSIVSSYVIASIEMRLKSAQHAYLSGYGWKQTCNTPGSFWLWVRDFSDIDEDRRSRHPPKASPFVPYGRIMATTEIAIMMTQRTLETPREETPDDA